MSSTDSEIGTKNPTSQVTYERLEKDVAAVKDDITALSDQITKPVVIDVHRVS